MNDPAPLLSVILPTDGPNPVRGVLNHLGEQTLADRIEVVLVTPDPEGFDSSNPRLAGFSRVSIIRIPDLKSLGRARAMGLEAALAPYAFLGETHSFASAPDWAERLLQRHEEGWSVVVPGFHNANPRKMLSWAGFLLDYGGWMHDQPAREINYWPLNNCCCDRKALLGATDDPAHALSYGDQLLVAMEKAGKSVWFEPEASLSHINISRWKEFIDEHWIGGHLVASYRSRDWSILRRLAYAGATPLIAVVLFFRVLSPTWGAIRRNKLSMAILPTMMIGIFFKVVGEAVGYLGLGSLEASELRMTEYELHKHAYA